MKRKFVSLVAAGILCVVLALPAAAQDVRASDVFGSIYEAISAFFGQFGSDSSEGTPSAAPCTMPGGLTVGGDLLEATPHTMPGGIAEEEPTEAAPLTMPGG